LVYASPKRDTTSEADLAGGVEAATIGWENALNDIKAKKTSKK